MTYDGVTPRDPGWAENKNLGLGVVEPEEKVFDVSGPVEPSSIEKKIARFPHAVNDLAVELTAIAGGEADAERLLCDRLFEMTGALLVSLSVYDPDARCIRVRKVSTRGRLLPIANRIMGLTLARVAFPVNDTMYQKMLSMRVEDLDGIYGLMLGAIPRRVCHAVDRALGVGHAYGLAYQYNGHLMGSSTIWMPRGAPPLPLANLVTFANFGAAALHSVRMHKKLQSYHDELRRLAADLLLAEDRERKKIAEAIHDDLLQVLGMSSMLLHDLEKDAESPASKARVQEAAKMLERAIQDTRSLTFRLTSPFLSELGLVPALEHMGKTFAAQNDFNVHVDDDGLEKELGDAENHLLFRSVRELMFNVAKHARAENVWIQIKREDAALLVEVEDDGVGMESGRALTATKTSGFGLVSIRETLHSMGGELVVESIPGQGFKVRMSLPVEPVTPLE